jgi:hypothetical protein
MAKKINEEHKSNNPYPDLTGMGILQVTTLWHHQ